MLNSISPIDGRYRKTTEPLAQYFSESALMKFRIVVEGEYLIALSDAKLLRKLSEKEKQLIRSLYDLSDDGAEIISNIETQGWKNIKATDHDVKAIEYYMKEKLGSTSLKDVLEWIHFGLTSYDVNTPARAMMLSEGVENILVPKIGQIIAELEKLAKKYAMLPMLARTHGQPASPTTFGKEFKVFAYRLQNQFDRLKKQKLSVKFSGASGNFNALTAAFPKIDWPNFAGNFISILNKKRLIALEYNPIATQIDPHDNEAEIFDNLRRINTILLDFNQDIWRYISDEWVVQKAVEGEIGSSAMPHKINPIKFENSEGNLGLANALFEFFARKLPISRLQRDLSDSTVERNFGTALAHCLIAYDYLLKGLARVTVNNQKVTEALNSHPEVIAEAIQTVLRAQGINMPYEKLKDLTRGKQVTLAGLHQFIDNLDVTPAVKKKLKSFTPANYIGLAGKLAAM